MKFKYFALALGFAFLTCAQAAGPKVVGYYPYWVQYSQFFPKDVQFNRVTDIHYTSLAPSEAGELAFVDETDAEHFKDLAKLSKENGVNLVAVLGGAEAEANLKTIAASADLRSAFVASALKWAGDYGLSGVELDWQNLTVEDAENYKALLNALLEGFRGKGSVSASVYPFASADAYDAATLNQLDYVTVFVGDRMTEAEALLKPNASGADFATALSTMAGKSVNKDKLIPVIPLYGKSFAEAKGLGTAQKGVGSGNDGILSYKDLMTKFDTPDYKVSFDESTQSEVAVSNMETIVFMGIPSVDAVAKLVKTEGYGGAAVFDLSEDHSEPLVSLLVTIGLQLRPDVQYVQKKR